METAIISLLALLIGAAVSYFIFRSIFHGRARQLKEQTDALSEQCATLSREKGELNVALATLQERNANLERTIEEGKAAQERLLEESKAAKKEEAEASRRELEEQMKKLQLLFKDSASEILKEKSKDLSASNSEQMKNIVEPLSKKMEEFRSAVEDSKEKSLKNATAIEQQIKSMMEHTQSISREASNLASALKANNKTLGNWGEVILQNLLENMGLKMGDDFIIQETLKDADGNTIKNEESNRRMIPDAILFLPDKRAIVIDSKVSLNAFVDYSNAETDAQREEALKNHFRSVEAHVKELSEKKYSQYLRQSGKDSLEYVVMFVPNEGAFQLYFQNFKSDWHAAFEKKIVICGESNLFAMLKIIDAAWIQITQQKNLEDVMKIAAELLDRVGRFVNTFDDIGATIDKSYKKFEDARRALTGRQSIVTTAKKLEKKGVPMGEKFHAALLPPSDQDETDESI